MKKTVHKDLVIDTNLNSIAGGMFAYTGPKYLRNQMNHKRNRPSGIYCLGRDDLRRYYAKTNPVSINDEGGPDLPEIKVIDTNLNSIAGGMFAYTGPKYLRNQMNHKRNRPSGIYCLGRDDLRRYYAKTNPVSINDEGGPDLPEMYMASHNNLSRLSEFKN
ncbi:hypothetical protein Glove_325g3 [Diversispora epigaea]|uniref:Uncharacterized protein n=1 Tax=Diversispora epigaea TaxID=1348612 RepID=A0A397HMN7_9GLOM|nr:hypothetical protein Glove_325g3 [Diversispora epigaea]